MLGKLPVLFLVLHVAFACDFPNGTDAAMHWWDCGDGTVKLYSATPLDMSGGYLYPIKLNAPMNLAVELDNQFGAMPNSDSMKLDIAIWQYGGWSGCKWTDVPTFGMTNNLPACTEGVPCPINTGRQTVTVNLDFTKYASIVALLKNDSPYQLQYKITNSATGHGTCIVLQARAYTS